MRRPVKRLDKRQSMQHEEMEKQRRFNAALAQYPQDWLCQPCQTRQVFDPICAECTSKIRKYASV